MRWRTTGAAIAAVAVTGGCQSFEDAEPGETESSIDFSQVQAMLDESDEVIVELVEVQLRLVLDCVEERGFAVHDQFEIALWNIRTRSTSDIDVLAYAWLGDPDLAAEWGFGRWTQTMAMYDSDEATEYNQLAYGDDSLGDIENAEFDALPDEERYGWYVAFYGEERAQVEQGHLVGEFGSTSGGFIPSTRPGGCIAEMVEATGVSMDYVEYPLLGEGVGDWTTYPMIPGTETIATGELDVELLEHRTADDDFLGCLSERGWGEWSFADDGSLNLVHFLDLAYGESGEGMPESFTVGVPDPPSDVPTDAEGRREWEIGFATELHECVDETGFRESAEAAWDQVYGEFYRGLEAETFAWQEEMREYAELAQEAFVD